MLITVKMPAFAGAQTPLNIIIGPEAAPGITMPTNVVPSLETTMPEIPPIVNDDGLLRFVPVIVTNVPTGPVSGVKEVMVGAGITINAPETAVVAVPQPVTMQ